MNEFKQELKVPEKEVYGKPESKFRQEMDVYRDLVETSLPGFFSFMEGLNKALNMLEDEFIMSNLEFRARLKDTIGTLKTSDHKPLDDIFGFEIITPNEADKELIMLLINKMFDDKYCSRAKKHNKTNGYKAYHRVGSLKKEHTDSDFDNIEEYILNATTIELKEEHRDKSREEQKSLTKEELFEEVYLYPELRKLIQEGNLSKTTIDAIIRARETVYANLTDIPEADIPVIELQFKTKEVAEEAKFGTASHNYYKPVDQEKIKKDYVDGKLIRGIHYPFKFQRMNGRMVLQTSNLTLFEMFPFLKDTIIKYKMENPKPISSYNMHFAIVFPALKPYVRELAKKEPYHVTKNTNKYSVWEILKSKIINPDYKIPEYPKRDKEGEEK